MKFFSLQGWSINRSENIPLEPDPGNAGEGKRDKKGSCFLAGAFLFTAALNYAAFLRFPLHYLRDSLLFLKSFLRMSPDLGILY